MGDALAALRLLIEWGADEALGTEPVDRFAPVEAPVRPPPRAAPVRPGPAASVVPLLAQAADPDALGALATLEALYDHWDAQAAHPLRMTAMHTVRPAGRAGAKLLVLGDAPDADDDRSGRAFSGAAGALLDRVMGSAGLGRETALLATLAPWRPPGNRKLSESEVRYCLPFVHRLLAIARPERLILLGTHAIRALTGETGTARRLRGRWLPVRIVDAGLTIPAIAFPPVEQWLHNSATKQQVWTDLLTVHFAVTTAAK